MSISISLIIVCNEFNCVTARYVFVVEAKVLNEILRNECDQFSGSVTFLKS